MGSIIEFVTPPAKILILEYYKHHDLPLGRISVAVDGGIPVIIDSCCPTHCFWNHGHGLHETIPILENGAYQVHNVTITLKGREGSDTQCSVFGNDFSLTSIIGLAD